MTAPGHTRFADTVAPKARRDLLGSVTPGRLRGPGWKRTGRGLYVPSDSAGGTTGQRVVEASSLLPAGGAVGGWAAAWALGVDLCDGLGLDGRTLLDVPLCVGPARQIRGRPGVELWYDRMPAADVTDVDGVPVTGPRRTCFDGMRRARNLVEAVVHVDLLLSDGLVDRVSMREYLADHAGWRGVPQGRRALALAEPAARNGWETRMRMVWVLHAALPRPLCNPPVFDLDGNLLGYPDLLDPDAGTIGEFDGGGHREPTQHRRDNIREEVFEDHVLVVTRATSADLRHPEALAARMRRAHARGQAHDRRRDRWTLEAPPGWGGMGAAGAVHALLDTMDREWSPPW